MKKAHITCPYCHVPAQLRPASSIYGIHTKDRAAKLYVCSRYPACDAYVQAHKATGLPMGTLANKELRQKRMHILPTSRSIAVTRLYCFARNF